LNEPEIIAIANYSGGVGKTTMVINLAEALARKGKKTLIVDADNSNQISFLTGLSVPINNTLAHMLYYIINQRDFDPAEAILRYNEFDIIAAGQELAKFQSNLVTFKNNLFLLKTYIDMIKSRYDYVLIDGVRAQDVWAFNILIASTKVLIPIKPGVSAAKGMERILASVSKVKRLNLNSQLQIAGIVYTMTENGEKNFRITTETIQKEFADVRVLKSMIAKSTSFALAAWYGQSIFEYDYDCSGAKDYLRLADELFNLHNKNASEVSEVKSAKQNECN